MAVIPIGGQVRIRYSITLTAREFTLVRVACLTRLDRLKVMMGKLDPENTRDAALLDGFKKSYDETRAMMQIDGPLYIHHSQKEGGAR